MRSVPRRRGDRAFPRSRFRTASRSRRRAASCRTGRCGLRLRRSCRSRTRSRCCSCRCRPGRVPKHPAQAPSRSWWNESSFRSWIRGTTGVPGNGNEARRERAAARECRCVQFSGFGRGSQRISGANSDQPLRTARVPSGPFQGPRRRFWVDMTELVCSTGASPEFQRHAPKPPDPFLRGLLIASTVAADIPASLQVDPGSTAVITLEIEVTGSAGPRCRDDSRVVDWVGRRRAVHPRQNRSTA